MIIFRSRANYLSAAHKQRLKEQIDQDSSLSPTMKKIKYFAKEFKYLFKEGHSALIKDFKWFVQVKNRQDLTAHETFSVRKIRQSLRRYLPYLFFLTVPGSSPLLAPYLYLFPHAAPMHFTFYETHQKRLKQRSDRQEAAYSKIQEFIRIGSGSSTTEIYEQLKLRVDFGHLTSEQWIILGDFLAAQYYTGTTSINKIANIFTWIIPNIFTRLWWLLIKKVWKPHRQFKEFTRWKDMPIMKFNFFPFQRLKRTFVRRQVEEFVWITMKADEAARKTGLADQSYISMVEFCLERSIFCSVTSDSVGQQSDHESLVEKVNTYWLSYCASTVPERICLSIACYHFLRHFQSQSVNGLKSVNK